VTNEIEHVSDTALMVAACRAIETRREDGQVRDPFAARLAGERGMAFARSGPFQDLVSFVVGLRARLMDELIVEMVRTGEIETVANLGAGLDTRPWRLDLPPTLRWIEADFGVILDYKHSRLDSETPHCRLERLPVDLASPEARGQLFERVGPDPALMITEGLLMYLTKRIFTAIAEESAKFSGIRQWLLDVAVLDAFRRMTGGGRNDPIERLRPADHLQGQEVLDAAREPGWQVAVARPYARDFVTMSETRRERIREAFKQAGNRASPRDEVSGVYLLKQAQAA
jgi:methyltransferase (TIGR00027 family)